MVCCRGAFEYKTVDNTHNSISYVRVFTSHANATCKLHRGGPFQLHHHHGRSLCTRIAGFPQSTVASASLCHARFRLRDIRPSMGRLGAQRTRHPVVGAVCGFQRHPSTSMPTSQPPTALIIHTRVILSVHRFGALIRAIRSNDHKCVHHTAVHHHRAAYGPVLRASAL